MSYFDLAITPMVFIAFLGYHLFLIYKTRKSPPETYFSSEIHHRRQQLQVRKTFNSRFSRTMMFFLDEQ